MAAGLAGVIPQGARAAAGTDPFAGDDLYADVVRYAGFGDKRTATPADHAVSHWLAGELKAAGLEPVMLRTPLRQFFPDAVSLEVGGVRVDAFPLWFPKATGPKGISGRLAPLAEGADLEGRIAVALWRGAGSGEGNLPERAARLRAAGLVQITRTLPGLAFAYNSYRETAVPTLLVGSAHEEHLMAAAASGEEAELVIAGRIEEDAHCYRVFASLERGPRRLIVSTPTSAHFTAAGERGPGIAIFLALLRHHAGRTGGPSVTFLCPAGHEMQGAGMRAYLAENAPRPEAVSAWLHLGASIAVHAFEATARGPRKLAHAQEGTRLIANRPAFLDILRREFARLPYDPQESSSGRGYLGLIFEAGYPAFGFEGPHAYFHTPADLPFVTSGAILEPVARAVAASLEAVGRL